MTSTLPTRHPDSPVAVPAGIRAFATLLGLAEPDAGEFRRLGEDLTVGDEPADRLVEWMFDAGMSETRPLFEQALAGGVDSVDDVPGPLREFFEPVESVPAWVDREKVELGARVMRSGGADGLYLARDVSLLGGYLYSGFNQTLLRTGALQKGSNKRFAETAQWAIDVITEGGLEPGGVGYRSTVQVRIVHAMVRRHVTRLRDWEPERWGLPVNQTDMAATLVGALLSPMMGGIGIGLVNSPREYEAAAHLTRYVGFLMGVDDRYLPNGFRDAVRILYHTSTALSTPDETSRRLAAPMAEDPLSWNYDNRQDLRRRIAKSQHLSIARAFLGSRSMRTLGLPTGVVPWYPVLKFPLNAVRSGAAMLPGGRERAAVRGGAEQERFMRTLVRGGAEVGHSAATMA